nr:T9SS type A sorting domain-containing protein [Prolixibacteraceae bacterium]
PNPVTGNSVFIENINDEKVESICLLNSMGQKQHINCIKKQGDVLIQIDLHEQKKGVYFLHAIINKSVFSEKIIIK